MKSWMVHVLLSRARAALKASLRASSAVGGGGDGVGVGALDGVGVGALDGVGAGQALDVEARGEGRGRPGWLQVVVVAAAASPHHAAAVARADPQVHQPGGGVAGPGSRPPLAREYCI